MALKTYFLLVYDVFLPSGCGEGGVSNLLCATVMLFGIICDMRIC